MWYLLYPTIRSLPRNRWWRRIFLFCSGSFFCTWIFLHVRLAQRVAQVQAIYMPVDQQEKQKEKKVIFDSVAVSKQIFAAAELAGVVCRVTQQASRIMLYGSLPRLTYAVWLLERENIFLKEFSLKNEGAMFRLRGGVQCVK